METKEVKITPPEGYEIDKENSTFECIKFKKIEKEWRDNEDKKINGYYIDEYGDIQRAYDEANTSFNYNIFATEKQAKSALAMARISQIMANDERFGGVVTYEEWDNENIAKYGIYRANYGIGNCLYYNAYNFLAFHTAEQRDLFLKENKDLIKDYLML